MTHAASVQANRILLTQQVNDAKAKLGTKAFRHMQRVSVAVAALGASIFISTPIATALSFAGPIGSSIALFGALPFALAVSAGMCYAIDRKTHYWSSKAAEKALIEAKVKVLDETLQHSRLDIDAYAQRGALLLRQGEYEKAFNDLERVLKFKPNHLLALSSRGACYLHIGQIDEALKDLNAALAIKADDISALTARSKLFLKQGKKTEALKDLSEAFKIAPADRNLYLARQHLLAQNIFTRAFLFLKKSLSRYPMPLHIRNICLN